MQHWNSVTIKKIITEGQNKEQVYTIAGHSEEEKRAEMNEKNINSSNQNVNLRRLMIQQVKLLAWGFKERFDMERTKMLSALNNTTEIQLELTACLISLLNH